MIIVILDIVFFLLFLFAGIESGHVFLAIIVWLLLATPLTALILDAEYKINTDDGEKQLDKMQEFEKKEWDEWRWRQ